MFDKRNEYRTGLFVDFQDKTAPFWASMIFYNAIIST